jgi:hypothetical protein
MFVTYVCKHKHLIYKAIVQVVHAYERLQTCDDKCDVTAVAM